jgi:membrane carboxypeptidase/penicillin-binding protein PbpC
MLYLVGIKDFLDYATDELGYTIPDRNSLGLSLTLGGVMVNPIEHISAFGIFANEGERAMSRAILRVEDASGNVLMKTEPTVKRQRVMTEETARQISSILSDNAARAFVFGERNTLTLGDRPVAAKTGTTNNYKDAWIVGYTPSLVAGVWAGDQKGEKFMDAYGGNKLAGPIWNQFMRKSLEGTSVEQFTAPQPVVTGKPVLDGDKSSQFKVRIDKFTGKLATDMTPADMVEERPFGGFHDILFFVKRDDPRGPAPRHPEDDPQFALWEKGVATWAEKQGMKATGEEPPTATDDVHVPANQPSVSFVSPQEGGSFDSRSPIVAVLASALRGVASVEYQLDGEMIGWSTDAVSPATLFIPNHFSKGFHVLTAIAYDDARNRAATSINVNLNASAGELGLTWRDFYPGVRLSAGAFPYSVRFSVTDVKSIAKLRLYVMDASGNVTALGEMESPALPDLAMTWPAAASGAYTVTAAAVLTTGEERAASVSVVVE